MESCRVFLNFNIELTLDNRPWLILVHERVKWSVWVVVGDAAILS